MTSPLIRTKPAFPDETARRPASVANQPCAYLWKDVIRVGDYRHPTRRFSIKVDRRRLDHWASAFRRMRANGVRVHIPADHSDAAADNRGFVLDLKRVGDRLMALCQFIGADAAREAARNQVSVGIAPLFIDGRGRAYRDAIVHVALTPVPVVPGQRSFVPHRDVILKHSLLVAGMFPAAETSAGAAPAGILTLAAAAAYQRRIRMAQRMLPCSDESLSALHELVPGLDQVPDEQKVDHVVQHLQGLASDDDEDAGSPEEMAALSRGEIHDRARQRRRDALAALADNQRQTEELSLKESQPAAAIDQSVRDALLEAVKVKRDLCVSRGALSPAVADVLMARLTNAEGGLVTLSQGSTSPAMALSIFSVLADNRPVAPGERTGSQVRSMQPVARQVPGDGKGKGTPLYEKMAAMASGRVVEL